MDNIPLVIILIIFVAGLVLGRKSPVVLMLCLGLIIGVLIASNEAGEFVHTLADGAWRFIT